MEIISKSKSGQLTHYAERNLYSMEFGNLYFVFAPAELNQFRDYLMRVDYEYYIDLNRNAANNRKLLLQLAVRNAMFCLHLREYFELRELLGIGLDSHIIKNAELATRYANYN